MSSNASKKIKKVQKIVKDKIPPAKRFKTLSSYSTIAEGNEFQKLYSDNVDVLFSIVLEKWNELEGVNPLKKGKTHIVEVLNVLELLKKMVSTNVPSATKKWKNEKVHSILQQCFVSSVKPSVRIFAFKLLLSIIELLPQDFEEEAKLFANAINLNPFVSPGTKLKNFPQEAKDPENVVCPNTEGKPTKEDSIAMIEAFFEVAEKKEFDFWFNLFREYYLSAFFPKTFQELGMMYKSDDTGFQQGCPPEIVQCIIDNLSKWANNPAIMDVLWNNSNAPLLIEISRQSCLLPLSFSSAIFKSNELFKQWLTDETSSQRFGTRQQRYWQNYISNVCTTFSRPEKLDNPAFQALIKKSLLIISSFANEWPEEMDNNTWTALQSSFLRNVHGYFIACSTNESEMGGSPDSIFHTLFYVWIKSPATTKEMWSGFQSQMSALVEWKAVVVQWKEKFVQLTYILKDFIYGVVKDAELFGRVRKTVTAITRDSNLDAIPWNAERITEVWFIMLEILGNLNHIHNPINHQIAISSVQESTDLLMQAELETLKFDESQPIPLMGVFLPILLEACNNSDNSKIKGRLAAYNTVCDMFCHQSFRPIDNQLLSHFYRLVISSLKEQHPQIIWQLISGCRNVFSLDLPGSYILIPQFLVEIGNLFQPNPQTESPPNDCLIDAITIVASLIAPSLHLTALSAPSSFKNSTSLSWMSPQDIQKKLKDIIDLALKHKNGSVVQHALCCLTTFICDVLTMNADNSSFQLGPAIEEILIRTAQPNSDVCNTALDCLNTISAFFTEAHNSLCSKVMASLCETTLHLLSRNLLPVEEIVSTNHYFTMMECLISNGSHFVLNDGPLSSRIFLSIQKGLEHSSTIIKDAAENVMVHLLEVYNNFPYPSGAERSDSHDDSALEEEEDQNSIYYVNNGHTILRLTSYPNKTVKVVSRNSVGKHIWTFSTLTSSKLVSAPLYNLPNEKDLQSVDHKRRQQPKGNALSKLVERISKVTNVQLEKSSAEFDKAISACSNELKLQSDKEKPFIDSFQLDQSKILRCFPSMEVVASHFQSNRLFTIQLGLFNIENLENLKQLSYQPKMKSMITELDSIPFRELHKFGVIYVPEGQEDQKSIFKNHGGSEEYNDFIHSIGWEINLNNHRGYLAGLDPSGSSGPTSIYYSNPLVEIAYHVITKMTDSGQNQISEKKKLIGNDAVHIIWSEHPRDYNPSVITTQFNDAHIIIYPNRNGLYRIQIIRKEKIGFFGPLLDEMVVSRRTLAILVRQTAINANKNVRTSSKNYIRQNTIRRDQILQIVDMSKEDLALEDQTAKLFVENSQLSEISNA